MWHAYMKPTTMGTWKNQASSFGRNMIYLVALCVIPMAGAAPQSGEQRAKWDPALFSLTHSVDESSSLIHLPSLGTSSPHKAGSQL